MVDTAHRLKAKSRGFVCPASPAHKLVPDVFVNHNNQREIPCFVCKQFYATVMLKKMSHCEKAAWGMFI